MLFGDLLKKKKKKSFHIPKVQFHRYPEEMTYAAKPSVAKHNSAIHEKYQRFNDYSEYRMPEALSAMQKLQKLKELQMKRDISERYYTQEIKRLIGEYYFGPKITSPSVRSAGRLQSSSFHPSSADRLKHVSNIYFSFFSNIKIKTWQVFDENLSSFPSDSLTVQK